MTSLNVYDQLALTSKRKDFHEQTVFVPENMLREARRQRRLPTDAVPSVCVLDPDGDVLRHLRNEHGAIRMEGWACYHTELWVAEWQGLRLGIIGCAVGASFAVLVAEELFATGCLLLISVTSAGRLGANLPPSCMILISEAIRGEGTSQAYLPPAPVVQAESSLIDEVYKQAATLTHPLVRGMVWTTDAPFRETESALVAGRNAGALAVEMEAAALYAFAEARQRAVVCFAHVTNDLAIEEGDFEKGPSEGADRALEAIRVAARGWELHSGTRIDDPGRDTGRKVRRYETGMVRHNGGAIKDHSEKASWWDLKS